MEVYDKNFCTVQNSADKTVIRLSAEVRKQSRGSGVVQGRCRCGVAGWGRSWSVFVAGMRRPAGPCSWPCSSSPSPSPRPRPGTCCTHCSPQGSAAGLPCPGESPCVEVEAFWVAGSSSCSSAAAWQRCSEPLEGKLLMLFRCSSPTSARGNTLV